MIPWIIIGSIVLLFAILFSFSVRVEVKFYGGVLDLKVKYMFLTLFSLNTAEKKDDSAEKYKKSKKKKRIKKQKNGKKSVRLMKRIAAVKNRSLSPTVMLRLKRKLRKKPKKRNQSRSFRKKLTILW